MGKMFHCWLKALKAVYQGWQRNVSRSTGILRLGSKLGQTPIISFTLTHKYSFFFLKPEFTVKLSCFQTNFQTITKQLGESIINTSRVFQTYWQASRIWGGWKTVTLNCCNDTRILLEEERLLLWLFLHYISQACSICWSSTSSPEQPATTVKRNNVAHLQ